ncbi:myotubularin, putative, partial [Entamoeba invadens IP1]
DSIRSMHGWSVYNIYSEFSRLKLEGKWKVCEYNDRYEICNSYPTLLIVPVDIHKKTLLASSDFRTNGRIPVLTWFDQKSQKALLRSSQPKTGFTGKSDEDVLLLFVEGGESYVQIYDCRDYYSALGNKAFKQAGFESTSEYTFCSLEFLNLPNIHKVRECSLELYNSFLSGRECLSNLHKAGGWILNIQNILQASDSVSKMLSQKSVLVHCSDGWDRTSQICSLSQIILDPFYRTKLGFAVLVEKDWLAFGHQFNQRLGISHDINATSPIFFQFLHCVHVLLIQNQTAFEFNDSFLQTIADELITARFGTFLFNSEKERRENKAPSSTPSLWDAILDDPQYTNNSYKTLGNRLIVNTSLLCISGWLGYFLRYSHPDIAKLTLY